MALVRGVSDATEQASGGTASRGTHHLVTIDPTFAVKQPTITDCPPTGCVTPAQAAGQLRLPAQRARQHLPADHRWFLVRASDVTVRSLA
jgi:hypothetical protein